MDIRDKLNQQDVKTILNHHTLPLELYVEGYDLVDCFKYVNDAHSLVDYQLIYFKASDIKVRVTTRYKIENGWLSPLYSQVNHQNNLIMVCKHDEQLENIFFVHANIDGVVERFNICSNEWIRPIFTKNQLQEVKKQGGFFTIPLEPSKNKFSIKTNTKKIVF